MPVRDIYDLKHWRSRAKEMRVLAEGIYDTETRRIMTRLADGWDKMADGAERFAVPLEPGNTDPEPRQARWRRS
jgi:hypothetical protein